MNTETKRHIDSARQVLVGVVPNPTSQIDQITNALIYKFMDDMDQAAIKAGGDPSFFVGDLEKYAWTRLMDQRIGNQERMNLYSEALMNFSQAKQLPELFRNIFKSAFLPYRSPETLGLFLKEINYFNYSHPEELGNAYEYLLSIMSSQGDAGQFRTPRNIIDFIVDVVNPTKDDKILDPACGTGGFLVKSYQHILEQHDQKDDPKMKEKPLAPDDRKKLMNNFEGYDIDPGMARIAQVNMYLHQFKNPKIYQYDTLSMEDRWNDKFDVILANPPFMSPKGGIKPHTKFSIQSSRSEVLFVDYIINHLRPKGRAGIIVPEGIIFQSGKAHKELRKNLLNDGLYAVVSLPSGVFAPYSGVKTSILLFNNELAKQKKEILFVKIENDGFDLGATKRPINKNNLPEALEILNKWRIGKKTESKIALYVEKTKINENNDYSLSGDRYRIMADYTNLKWSAVKLESIAANKKFAIVDGPFGTQLHSNEYVNHGIPVVRISNLSYDAVFSSSDLVFISEKKYKELKRSSVFPGDIILAKTGATIGKLAIFPDKYEKGIIASSCIKISLDLCKANPKFIVFLLSSTEGQNQIINLAAGATRNTINIQPFSKIKIPLPPLEVQEQIVAELEGYQKIIDGIQQAVSNWKPRIDIEPKWEKVKLGDVCDVRDGTHDSPKQVQKGYPLITSKNIKDGKLDFSNVSFISEEDFKKVSKRSYVDVNDIIMPMIGTIGGACLIESKENEFAIKNVALFKNSKKILPKYLLNILNSNFIMAIFERQAAGATQKFVSLNALRNLEIPFPSLKIQKQIVEKIEFEKSGIDKAKELIPIFEQHKKNTIEKLWSDTK